MLMRFDPFRELDRVAQIFNQGPSASTNPMPMDAYRENDDFVVHFDLPGVDPQSVDLTVEKNVLTVRAERSWPVSERQELLVSERPQGIFTRQLFLGESLDSERVDANYSNGVLTLVIPVREQAKPRKVAVHSAEGDRTTIEARSPGSGERESESGYQDGNGSQSGQAASTGSSQRP